jgi:hypothetical protein
MAGIGQTPADHVRIAFAYRPTISKFLIKKRRPDDAPMDPSLANWPEPSASELDPTPVASSTTEVHYRLQDQLVQTPFFLPERVLRPIFLTLIAFLCASVRPRTPLARAIALALALKCVGITAIKLFLFPDYARPSIDVAAVENLIGVSASLRSAGKDLAND